ncbi:MAG TPA: fibronectin type III domain-containing protein [Candidatus Kapabacteria bacterium]
MKLRYSLMTLAVAMGLTFGLSSCTEEDNPIVPGVGIPTDVMVNTLNENQITATWTRSSDDVDADTLIVIAPDGTERNATAMGTTTTATVTGLSLGTVYTVKVASVGGRTTGFEWATAIRTQGLTIYETTGSGAGQPSGIALSYNGAKSQALSINSPDSLKIDLVLATDPTADAAFLSLQGANVIGSQIPTGKSAQLGDTVFIVNGGLDADYYSSGFSSRITTKKYFDQFNRTGGSAIVLVKTMEGNYARVEVKEQADGKLFRMVGGVKAVDLIVSYQPLGGKAYASRPITRRGFSVPKLAGEGSVAVVKNAVK